MRSGRCAPGPGEVSSGAPSTVDGTRAPSTVDSTRFCAGSATAPAIRSPFPAAAARAHRATWTAQSVLPGSPNSRVPSRGSTIHTLSAASLASSSVPSSERTASSGRSLASSAIRNSWDCRSPAFRRASGSPPPARRVSSKCPARSAKSAARAWSSRADKRSPPGVTSLSKRNDARRSYLPHRASGRPADMYRFSGGAKLTSRAGFLPPTRYTSAARKRAPKPGRRGTRSGLLPGPWLSTPPPRRRHGPGRRGAPCAPGPRNP